MLLLHEEARSRIATWAAGGHPLEVCGLLIGRSLNGRTEVVRAELARNLRTDRACDRYELDPGDFVAIDARARADGLDVIGVWHSHPDRAALPSETDRQRAFSGWTYLIVEVRAGGAGALRAWRPAEGGFEESELCAS